MLQVTLHLTLLSRLWTFQLLGFEVFQVRLQKKTRFYRFYRDTQWCDFQPLFIYLQAVENRAFVYLSP
jgi:hypothetical protein